MPNLKFRLKKDIALIGYRTLKAGTVYEAVRENSRYVYINENHLLIRLLRSDCEVIKKGRKKSN